MRMRHRRIITDVYGRLAANHREAVVARILGVKPSAVTQALHRLGIEKYVESPTDLKLKFLGYMLEAEYHDAETVRKEIGNVMKVDAEERQKLNYSRRRVPDKAYALSILISKNYLDAGMLLSVKPQGVWFKIHRLGFNDNDAVIGAFGIKLRKGESSEAFRRISEEIRKLSLLETARH